MAKTAEVIVWYTSYVKGQKETISDVIEGVIKLEYDEEYVFIDTPTSFYRYPKEVLVKIQTTNQEEDE